jgi:hypothetical protein
LLRGRIQVMVLNPWFVCKGRLKVVIWIAQKLQLCRFKKKVIIRMLCTFVFITAGLRR